LRYFSCAAAFCVLVGGFVYKSCAMTNKTLVIVLAVMLVASGAAHLIGLRRVRIANETLDSQRLRNESLLSEKLTIEKSTDKLKNEIESITDENKSAQREIAVMNETILSTDTRLEKVIADRKKIRTWNERLQRQIDSLARQMIVAKSEAKDEKQRLEDSIKYLIEFSESLSAELHRDVNQ